MEVLAKLFGSASKVKLIRLFVLNPGVVFSPREAARRSRVVVKTATRELKRLRAFGLLEKRASRSKERGWQLNQSFIFLGQLRSIFKVDLVGRKNDLARNFTRCGRLSLLVAAGVFLEDENGRADLLLVGDNLKKTVIERVVSALEADLGKELNYAMLTTIDFNYRLAAHDKFIRDILDYPHHVLINKLGI